jgi:DNA-binding transcriptional LysR family regulator
MNFRRLQYFVAVAEELSFRRAAARLQMSQPPLSSQIKQLEKELGVKVFSRTGRGIQLTEAGQFLLEEARRLLVQAEQTAEMTRRIGHGKVGRLTLGFLPSAAHSVLPPLLREFRVRFPMVNLHLREMDPDQQARSLHDKQIDVGLLYLPLDDDSLSIRSVLLEALIVALPEQHPLAAEPQVPMHALSNEPFVLPPQHQVPGCYGRIIEACHQAGFSPKVVQKDVWLMQTIVGLVAGGIGVALVPASLRNLSRTGVVYREVRDPLPPVELAVAWRRDEKNPIVHSFLEVVEQVCHKEGTEALAALRP